MFVARRYTQESTAIRYFLEVISELDAADQRRFLRFVTGSPRLPPGGIASLHPRCAHCSTVLLNLFHTCCAALEGLRLYTVAGILGSMHRCGDVDLQLVEWD